jgi:thiol-disulfide isomerase/thioredoxin
MRRVLIVLAAVVLAACGRQAEDSVIISGQIENPGGEEVEVFYYKEYVTNKTEMVKVALDEQNAFEAVLPLEKPHFVYVSIPPRTIMLYVKPGASLHVAFDAETRDQLPEVTGDNSLESSFILSYNIEVAGKYNQTEMFGKARELGWEGFTDYIEAMYQEQKEFLHAYPGYEDLDADFTSLMSTNILYGKYVWLLQYGLYYDFLHPESEVLPDSYFGFLEDAADFRDELTRSRDYFTFVNMYVEHKSEADEGVSRNMLQFDTAQELLSGKSREIAQAQIVISALSFGDFEEGLALYQRFSDSDVSADIAEIVQAEYEIQKALAPGMPAPGFTLTDINGDEVSLDDFLGKVVYLDFWASWCGPCIQQIPHAKELKKRMADHDDLVFLYVSVDTDEDAWRKMVADREIKGVHVNVNGFSHDVPVSYNLRGVPTFYLIGRDGNIFDNRPPRPSGENIDELLLAALGNN